MPKTWSARKCQRMCKSNSDYVRERVCIECGAVGIVRKDSTAVRCKHCSARRATAKSRENKNTKICPICGVVFFSCRSKAQKYCSAECRSVGVRKERIGRVCKYCGKEFGILPSILKTNASGNFCSRDCYNKWMCDDEYINGRGSRWKSIRKATRERTPFCCLCGKTHALEIHHVVPYRLSHDNGANNLVPLCKSCHKSFEHITHGVLSAKPDLEMMQFILMNILETYKMARLAQYRIG
jgi:5-methylcytosine-specific restriction endonuclease McrA